MNDPGPRHLTPAVLLLDPEPYNGDYSLKFNNAPQDISIPTPEAKKPHDQVKYSIQYIPPEVTPSTVVKETSSTTQPSMRRSERIAA